MKMVYSDSSQRVLRIGIEDNGVTFHYHVCRTSAELLILLRLYAHSASATDKLLPIFEPLWSGGFIGWRGEETNKAYGIFLPDLEKDPDRNFAELVKDTAGQAAVGECILTAERHLKTHQPKRMLT